jgi:hypothetical protein
VFFDKKFKFKLNMNARSGGEHKGRPHNPKVEGLDLATVAGTEREKMAKKIVEIFFANF